MQDLLQATTSNPGVLVFKEPLDRHVSTFGITGLSGAGKTAFITSLINCN